MSTLGNVTRALAFSGLTAGISMGLGEGCKSNLLVDVHPQPNGGHSIETHNFMLGSAINAVTNPDSIDLLDNQPKRDEVQTQATQIWKAMPQQEVVVRCQRYQVHLSSILTNPAWSNGIKLMRVHLADQVMKSLVLRSYVANGGDAAVIPGFHRASVQARQTIRARKTLEDYDPMPVGVMAFAGFSLVFLGSLLRDRSRKSVFISTLGYLAIVASGLLAVRRSDNLHQVHIMPATNLCREALSPEGLENVHQEGVLEKFWEGL